MTAFLMSGPAAATATLLFAHGAGAAMDSPWMAAFAEALGAAGVRVARFEFAYMAGRRSGTRRPPPRAESLMDEYRAAVDALEAPGKLVIGGKSMGGRVASLVAMDLCQAGKVAGLVCMGYPFHPPGKPEQLRTAHLEALTVPTLICQGTRDIFGSREEVATYALAPSIALHWLADGDHDLRPRKAVSGRSFAQNLDEATAAVTAFVTSL